MEEKQNTGSLNFPDSLPGVSSPEKLDREILAESRRLAPERMGRFMLSGWVPMAATAATIAVAFVIARPLLMEVEHSPAPQSAPMEEEAALRSRSESVEVQLSTPQAVSQDVAGQIRKESKKAKSELAPVTDAPPAPDSPARVQAESASAIVMEQPVDAEMASDEPIVLSSEKQDDDVVAVLGKQQLEEAIVAIEALLEAGEVEQARVRLKQLRKDCPACEIPESLKDL